MAAGQVARTALRHSSLRRTPHPVYCWDEGVQPGSCARHSTKCETAVQGNGEVANGRLKSIFVAVIAGVPRIRQARQRAIAKSKAGFHARSEAIVEVQPDIGKAASASLPEPIRGLPKCFRARQLFVRCRR
jgi:hypothetical protein